MSGCSNSFLYNFGALGSLKKNKYINKRAIKGNMNMKTAFVPILIFFFLLLVQKHIGAAHCLLQHH